MIGHPNKQTEITTLYIEIIEFNKGWAFFRVEIKSY